MSTRIEVRSGEGGDDALVFAGEIAESLAGFARRSGHTGTVDRSVRTAISGVDRAAKNFTWNWMRDEVIDHTNGKRIRLSDALSGKLAKLTS